MPLGKNDPEIATAGEFTVVLLSGQEFISDNDAEQPSRGILAVGFLAGNTDAYAKAARLGGQRLNLPVQWVAGHSQEAGPLLRRNPCFCGVFCCIHSSVRDE